MTLKDFFAVIGFLFTFVCVGYGMNALVEGLHGLSRRIFPQNGG